jgi:hypothetical protein
MIDESLLDRPMFLDASRIVDLEADSEMLAHVVLRQPQNGPNVITSQMGKAFLGRSNGYLCTLRSIIDISARVVMFFSATMYLPSADGLRAAAICALATSRMSTVAMLQSGRP